MHKKYLVLLTITLLIMFMIMLGCKANGEPTPFLPPEPSSAYTTISGQIASISPSSLSSIADILSAAQDIEKAKSEDICELADWR